MIHSTESNPTIAARMPRVCLLYAVSTSTWANYVAQSELESEKIESIGSMKSSSETQTPLRWPKH